MFLLLKIFITMENNVKNIVIRTLSYKIKFIYSK